VTPLRSLIVALLAFGILIGARAAAEAQFPRGLLAGPPGDDRTNVSLCSIATRPLSFGVYDPSANADLDAVAQVIYTCNNKGKNIRIEMAPGTSNQFDRAMSVGFQDRLNYNVYLDATHRTVWGNGTNGTDALLVANPANSTPVIVPAYGRVFAGQDVNPGEYRDILNVVILF
jgi:spore coat protein U-like protein